MVSIQLPKGRKFAFHTRIQPPSTDIVQDVRSLSLSETLPSFDRDRGCQTSPGNRGQEAPSRRRICWIHSCLPRRQALDVPGSKHRIQTQDILRAASEARLQGRSIAKSGDPEPAGPIGSQLGHGARCVETFGKLPNFELYC